MSKRQILMVLGAWVIVFLFLGFPTSWWKPLAVVSGLFIIIISYSVHPAARSEEDGQVSYVEHKSPSVAAPVTPSQPQSAAPVSASAAMDGVSASRPE